MAGRLQLAVDAMGGDGGPEIIVPTVIRYLSENPDVEIALYGLEDALLEHFPNRDPGVIDRCRVEYCSQIVTDQDSPSSALRHKQDSSMWLALQAVAEGRAGACVSAGNTGALMAMGLNLLGIHAGVERPAICTALPRPAGRCYLLDVGANVDCSAEQLQQFALMATALVSALEGEDKPPCSLLNIGKETIKGNKVVKQAAQLFERNQRLNYAGFIEADGLLQGAVEIVVCDGFSGNIALKAIEGSARALLDQVSQVSKALLPEPVTVEAKAVPNSFTERLQSELCETFDPRRYNGAILLGLNGLVIKSHGNADDSGYRGAIERAVQSLEADVLSLVNTSMAKATEE